MNLPSIKAKVREHLYLREGVVFHVYKDSLGKLTGGVGHLILPEDNLRYKDPISKERVDLWLEQDSKKALFAAIEQAKEMGVEREDWIVALTSVNFQLGVNWRNKFKATWGHLKAGRYENAIANIKRSLWAKQTPVRTNDFIKAIQDIQIPELIVASVTQPKESESMSEETKYVEVKAGNKTSEFWVTIAGMLLTAGITAVNHFLDLGLDATELVGTVLAIGAQVFGYQYTRGKVKAAATE